jgi:hypothetical protein
MEDAPKGCDFVLKNSSPDWEDPVPDLLGAYPIDLAINVPPWLPDDSVRSHEYKA